MANPLLTPSALPYGLPAFGEIADEHYAEAIRAGLAEHLAEIEAITSSPEKPDFENTAVAMERSGQLLTRAAAAFANQVSSHGTEGIRALETELMPELSAHDDAIYLNRPLYERFAAIPTQGLDPESARLVEEWLAAFRRSGIALDGAAQERLREINAELSRLGTDYGQRVAKGINEAAILVTDESELAGMPEDDRASAAEAARAAGHEAGWLLTFIQPTAQPHLAVLEDRSLRRRIFEASVARGSSGGATDVLALVTEMARLRAEKAALLGFKDFAELAVDDQTAPSISAVEEMLSRLAPAAVRNAAAEAEVLAQAAGHDLEPWDWAFYSAKVQREKYAVDERALRPYFELDRVLRDGVFYAAGQLYGLAFTERTDLVGYHEDVRVWEVSDADGSGLGLFLGDYFARPTKRGGAWMNSLVEQSRLLAHSPVVVNNLNIPKPPPGEPVLLTLDELRTVFHEFGHALHGLLSEVAYPRFSGTNVPRDFVEYPSQVNEMWMFAPEVVGRYARHHATGEPLPSEDLERLDAARLWGEGFATTEYLGASLLDLAWHRIAPGSAPTDAPAFEAGALADAGVAVPLVPPRYRTGYFQHIFAGGWYAAGYWSYIWSEVLDADTVEWFRENGGLSRANGEVFRRELLSRGNSRDPLESFRAFRGRDADAAPLMARRGLA
ncbi:peptidyl-dipeptidase Dcp [Sinomonas cellulolyticus]|uniref:M3 family metallopeptidase n=1 Tax=Sinomonas cellulolyticus TaxID=2801916 RepID=A0ABS1K0H5_9MICC|nr:MULTISPECIES: M3 family metallopeptidase [Sinomonas]MBL0705156.1 M3 family metallopeptidase [Sinomonas cellulolyticus]GHG39580.1 peptidyl-dipeptidase Dcp [Sinomonas sp. KCTC 49339]